MGWSMGGATVLQCITRSPLAEHVDGVVLESPVVDWLSVLRFQADAARLPAAVRDAALAVLGSGVASQWVGLAEPIDFARLDVLARAATLRIPMLLLHSDHDGYVPIDGSAALAAARPDVVRLERFATARHTKLWNFDAERWERAIRVWLADQGLSGATAAATSARIARPRRPQAADAAPSG
jgi:pimeloyl-ACP methyl ester carboxylesterase